MFALGCLALIVLPLIGFIGGLFFGGEEQVFGARPSA
jgi:hypothetical protein